MKGQFVISLDFEKFWGVFDVRSLENYRCNLDNVNSIVIRLLELSDTYNIKLTFATVGFLFAKTKEELLNYCPEDKPQYNNTTFSPYCLLENINPEDDEYYFANSLIELIKQSGNHEISSHTFSHYYCNETGQTKQQFKADLKAAIKIAKTYDIDITSIVYPRNQINADYIKLCADNGITNYRGNETHWMYSTFNTKQLENPLHRIFRLMDAYINISGYNTYKLESLLETKNNIVNVKSSRFLRPYSKKLSFLESSKLKRIKKAMAKAAKKGELFHLWFHPHNFGQNTDENFKILEDIFQTYSKLNKEYSFTSNTMSGLASNLLSKN